MDDKCFGKVIKKLRKEHKLTQKQLADLLCVSQAPVSRWESGDRDITLSMMQRMAKVFSLSLTDLVAMIEKEQAHAAETLSGRKRGRPSVNKA